MYVFLLAAALAAPPDAITIAAVGDIMLGTTYPHANALPPNDGVGLLDDVKPLLASADIAIGNLEGPLIDRGVTHKCAHRKAGHCRAFRVPTRYGRLLKDAGFTVMGVANNHALDFGTAGRASTRRVLDRLGLAHTGEVGDVAHLTVRGTRVAVVAFTTGHRSNDLNALDTARALVSGLAADGELVVVSFHGGAEGASRQHVPRGREWFYGENRGNLRRFTHAMIDAGASLVIGHGPHVVRGMELYKGRLIAYSLGNFATYGGMWLSGPTKLTMVLEARLAPDGALLGGAVHPVELLHRGIPRRDADGQIVPIVRRLSQTDFPQTSVNLAPDGTFAGATRQVELVASNASRPLDSTCAFAR